MTNSQLEQNLGISPYNPSLNELLLKIFVGFIAGLIVSFLIFVLIILFGDLIRQAIQTISSGGEFVTSNPILSIIILVIGFIVSFIGSMIISSVYNFFISDRYYDFGKLTGFTMISNGLIFFVFLFLYFLFSDNIETLILILILHISFALYVNLLGYDIISNPNYSLLYLIGHSFSLIFVLFFGFIGYKIFMKLGSSQWGMAALMIYFIVLVYLFYPIVNFIVEKIYYKFYENGSNSLYTPSINEILVDEEVVDEVNVEIDND